MFHLDLFQPGLRYSPQSTTAMGRRSAAERDSDVAFAVQNIGDTYPAGLELNDTWIDFRLKGMYREARDAQAKKNSFVTQSEGVPSGWISAQTDTIGHMYHQACVYVGKARTLCGGRTGHAWQSVRSLSKRGGYSLSRLRPRTKRAVQSVPRERQERQERERWIEEIRTQQRDASQKAGAAETNGLGKERVVV